MKLDAKKKVAQYDEYIDLLKQELEIYYKIKTEAKEGSMRLVQAKKKIFFLEQDIESKIEYRNHYAERQNYNPA